MKERIRCAQCDGAKNHPDHTYDHNFVDPRPVGMSPIGKRTQRFQASDAGKEYERTKRETQGEPCQIQGPTCTGFVEHLHEPLSRGRAGGLAAALRDGPAPIPCCDACNGYVSEHPVWARERGLLLSAKDIKRGDTEIEL